MIWDPFSTHRKLAHLNLQRAVFRSRRLLGRLRSPRRIIATSLAVAFFLLYLFNGVFILSARQPADPERLRLWLSGGMVIYAVYHLVRCVWTTRIADLELTPAERLWLGGAPIRRSSLAVYHIGNVLFAGMMKALLLAVVLAFDVNHFELFVIGVFGAMVLLETTRLLIGRWSAGLDRRRQVRMRVFATALAVCIALQVLARLFAGTPVGSPTWLYVLNSFHALGQTASCQAIQWLSVPWIASAELAVSEHYSFRTLLLTVISIALIPASIGLLVYVDAWACRQRLRREQQRLAAGDYATIQHCGDATPEDLGASGSFISTLQRIAPASGDRIVALIARQSISVRRYWGTIVFSFVVPFALCLSPLLTGQITEQWFFVVGGLALCTMLLAPPALRLDFRRDLQRMMLLRSLPVPPLQMVIGQLTIPILITLTFQWATIVIAALVTQPGASQVILWTGLLGGLAVFTFAAENALFLAYPHHERAEGIAMMIRAKLTFLGKAAVIGLSLLLLILWGVLCRQWLPATISTPAFVGGAIACSWSVALIAVAGATWCWRRFDLASDVPPE